MACFIYFILLLYDVKNVAEIVSQNVISWLHMYAYTYMLT